MICEAIDLHLTKYKIARILFERHLYLKGSKTSYFIMKSYFYKILMTEGFKTFHEHFNQKLSGTKIEQVAMAS